MISAFNKHIQDRLPFLKDKELLVAVSGGIDSIVLAHLLHNLNFSFSIAHCNFNLRGKESDMDATFVKDLSSNLKIPFYSKSFETEKIAKEKAISIQMAARELRYEWFNEIKENGDFDYILTAHNKDDVLETILINFTRGTGLSGLTGIPAINGEIIRPLLPFTRKEIVAYTNQHIISWREDSSNASTKYLRNKLRHDVIPILKVINPSMMETLDNTLEHLKGSQKIIDDTINKMRSKVVSEKNGTTSLSIKKINELEDPKPYLYELLKSYGFTEWDDVFNLIRAQSGKQIFSNTHRLIKNRDFLLLSKIEQSVKIESVKINEFKPIKTDRFKISFSENTDPKNNASISVDVSKLKLPLTIRKWKHGDVFYPTGMAGKKKVSKYFKDEKLSLLEKEQCWILENNDNKIIWITGKRADRRFETTSSTKESIHVHFTLND